MSIPYDQVMALSKTGIYESHYLKANSPDGQLGFWIKHTFFRPKAGTQVVELWFIWFERGKPPRVVRTDVPWKRISFGPGLEADLGVAGISTKAARGSLGGLSWDLGLSGGLPPLLHMGWRRLYRMGFPKKKMLTPVPNLRFDGELRLDGSRIPVQSWIGLRGHNWGTQHAHTYAYGNCNLWDDGRERTVDGFTARILLAGRPSPALSSLCVRAPEGDRELTRPRQWLRHGRIAPTRWQIRRPTTHLLMECEPQQMVGLRYNQPAGGEQYCYNTKFARVSLRLGTTRLSSNAGELETFFPKPLPDIPLHPPAGWTAEKGTYDSAAARGP